MLESLRNAQRAQRKQLRPEEPVSKNLRGLDNTGGPPTEAVYVAFTDQTPQNMRNHTHSFLEERYDLCLIPILLISYRWARILCPEDSFFSRTCGLIFLPLDLDSKRMGLSRTSLGGVGCHRIPGMRAVSVGGCLQPRVLQSLQGL